MRSADDFARILREGADYGQSRIGAGRRVNVEFVSANPTGPLHVGHGRGAALGDAIAALLEWTGHQVTREFYVNDAGVQIGRLAESVWARVQELAGRPLQIPEGGYHGDYLRENAAAIVAAASRRASPTFPPPKASRGAVSRCSTCSARSRTPPSRRSGVRFDVIASEQALYDAGKVEGRDRPARRRRTHVRGRRRALAAHSSFGDDRDRVLRKSDGTLHLSACRTSPTISTSSLAGLIARSMSGVPIITATSPGCGPRCTALGLPAAWFDVAIVQLVRVVRGGDEVKMSKRSGEFVTLRDLLRRSRCRRGALLVPDAAWRHAPGVRHRPRQVPDRREPGVLRPDGPRPDERHLPHGGDRPERRRRRPRDRRAHRHRPRAGAEGDRVSRDCRRAPRASTSRTGSRPGSKSWPGWCTAGTTAAGCWASRRSWNAPAC